MSQPWPADKVERRSVDSLIPYARNARTHSDIQISQIAASIKEWGWTTPILIDEDGSIIAGHGRVLAAKKLKLKNVPAMTAVGWSDAQKRAYVLADNQLTLNAAWDTELLKIELVELEQDEFDINLIGFNDADLAKLFSDPLSSAADEWDGMPEFSQQDAMAHRTIKVHFADDHSVEVFARLVQQTITEKTKFIWYPEAEREKTEDLRYVATA